MTPEILEVTLRDGSYAIDFGFSAADTATLVRELEACGFGWIEVGHGIGLGASEAGYGEAAATDDEYAAAAASAVKDARWGMFCIPGIAELNHLNILETHGADFVRIGTNVTDAEAAEPFVRKAKRLGLFVCCNFMKSYAVSPDTFGTACQQAELYGADLVYVVDSAGGMKRRDIFRYVEALRDACSLPFGFHGHDNLGLAVSNALYARELGATLVDTSLQGIGRSAGNTPTELFLLASREHPNIDPLDTLDVSERYVRPLLRGRPGIDPVDAVSGHAQFHSSFMPTIRRHAARHNVDPRRLIIALCKHTRVHAPDELVERLARGLTRHAGTARYRLDRYHGEEETVQQTTGVVV